MLWIRCCRIIAEIRELRDAVLNKLSTMEKKLMSGVDDLKAAVQAIADDLTAETVVINEVVTALQAGGLSDADAEALAQKLQGSAGVITTSTTTLTNALTPPPPPAQS
jgi:lysozyme family protein